MAAPKTDITVIPDPFQVLVGQIKANTSHYIRKYDILFAPFPIPTFFLATHHGAAHYGLNLRHECG